MNAITRDLLAALVDLVEQDECNRPDGPLLDCDKAYAAIAKAKEAQGTLAPYPDGPAVGKTDTSAQAAQKINLTVGTVRHRVFSVIKSYSHDFLGATMENIEFKTCLLRSTISARITELKLGGYIEDSGKRRKNIRGNNEIIWKTVTPKGEE